MASPVIRSLDDSTAQKILGVIARSRRQPTGEIVAWDPGLGQTLAHEFQISGEAGPVSEGELARQALLVLADDPETGNAIEAMAASSARAEKFDFGVTLGLTVAVMIALQTHVRFERNSDGKWNLKIEKKPTRDALLKGLVQKLIGFMK
jgi:hypothetical protein